MVGVGNGGELTMGFDMPITNDSTDHAGGMDFTIFGNEFFENGTGGKVSGTFVHPGLTVWVSQDNVNYYQRVAPASHQSGYGADSAYPTNQGGDPFLPMNSSLTLSNFTGLTLAQALSLYNRSAGGASYSISWAQDAQGNAINVPSISYIKVEGSAGYGYIDTISRVESIPEPCGAALIISAMGMGILYFLRSECSKYHGNLLKKFIDSAFERHMMRPVLCEIKLKRVEARNSVKIGSSCAAVTGYNFPKNQLPGQNRR